MMFSERGLIMEFQITHCTLCPRRCGCDRTAKTGFCGGGNGIRAARAALHFWEEPCISGTSGSGAVFFSGCPLHCCFCQNETISNENFGIAVTPQRLCDIFFELTAQGAHNINLVTPTHLLPWIREALLLARPRLSVPVIYNCGGYELLESLSALEGLVDIYIPDFKFFNSETAQQYAGAPDYPEIAQTALAEMLRQTGFPQIENGLMKRGCILRHLVLPGHRHESISLLHHLASVFGTEKFLLSLMAQYTPMHQDDAHPELNRRVTKMEYNSVLRTAQELGFHGYLQDQSAAVSDYTPDFHLQGL
jgi:putative pyruvate formate lyase activating enzyme